jgi:adenylosuccinate lyase
MLVIRARSGQVLTALDQVEDVLRRRRGLRSNQNSDFDLSTADKFIEQFDRITAAIGLVTIAISAVGLMVGGIGVMNIMLVSVTERTSSDIGDTALCVQMKQAIEIIIKRVETLLETVKEKAIQEKDSPCMGRSHGIHAEPMTLGLKFALFYAEMQRNLERLKQAQKEISVGKFSGAVGTYSNIDPQIEEFVCTKLGLAVDPITTQVITRDRHAFYLSILGLTASSLDRMATEIRLLQKTEGREVEEPFSKGQKGSSAMPHKRNPVICERISGIARVIRSNVNVGFQDMQLWHERDISHSSAERIVLPDSTIALDYILDKMNYVIKNLHIYPDASERVLGITRGLIFSQKLMLAMIERGGISREKAYEKISPRVIPRTLIQYLEFQAKAHKTDV